MMEVLQIRHVSFTLVCDMYRVDNVTQMARRVLCSVTPFICNITLIYLLTIRYAIKFKEHLRTYLLTLN